MRSPLAALIVLASLGVPALAETQAEPSFDWQQWRRLPVLDGGRHKPLDTLAWEALRMVGNRASLTDPETQEKLDATAAYLVMLFEWPGWDQPAKPQAPAAMHASSGHLDSDKADKWDRAALLLVDSVELRNALSLPEDQKHVSPLDLGRAVFQDPHSQAQTPFLAWAERLARNRRQGLSALEKKGLELADRYYAYRDHRRGRRLEVIPLPENEHGGWASVADLVQSKFTDKTDPTGQLRSLKAQFQRVRAAYLAGSTEEFNQASAEFIAAAQETGPEFGSYPSQSTIDLEVAYNRWVPFRFAWALTLIAGLGALLAKGTQWRPFYSAALTAYGAGLIAMLVGFGMRVAISGRAPVTNMYETVIYVGLGIAVLGLIFELIHRKQYILTASAAVCTFALILADNCPAILDPSLHPLQPVLRNNFWLITHVMTITLSYAAFALAMGIANVTLGYYLVGSSKQDVIEALSRFTYRSLQIGVLLLAVGIILGGVWADYSWGRFWGWDPKEVWALIALLGYLAVLHARYIGWAGNFGLAALSAVCFSLVVFAWYGVNFVLGTGLHSYGFGGGGQEYVGGAILAQFLYVLAAAARSAVPEAKGPPGGPPASRAAEPHRSRHAAETTEQVVS